MKLKNNFHLEQKIWSSFIIYSAYALPKNFLRLSFLKDLETGLIHSIWLIVLTIILVLSLLLLLSLVNLYKMS